MGSWYLIRHGETEWNRTGKIQGHSDVSLSKYGRRQMKMLGTRLAGCAFSAVYASDLSRSVESADMIVEGRETSIETDSDLREFFYGEWEGLTLEEVEARTPKVFAQLMASGNSGFAAPGGEDSAQVLDRVRRFYARTLKRHDEGENLLIVAHGGTLRALLVCLLDLTTDHFWRFRVDCGSLSVVNNHPNGRVLETWNDTGHLSQQSEEAMAG